MIRCLVRPEQVQRGVVWLDARQAKHLVTVLRLRVGEEFLVIAEGRMAHVAVLEEARDRRASARLVRPAALPAPEPWVVTLAIAIPRRPGAFDQIVDQATQVGVATMVPMITARSVVTLAGPRAANRQRRWQRLAVAAAEQSGRDAAPTVAPVTPLADLLAPSAVGQFDQMLLPTVGADRPLTEVARQASARRFLILVGPEGDLTAQEQARAQAAGACPVSLGPWVLRCETAAVAALAMLLQVLRAGFAPLTRKGVLWHS